MAAEREFDVVVYGATGYTGRLVAEYLTHRCAGGLEARWAMAGRSADKLAAVRDEIGAPKDTPLIVADAADAVSVLTMAGRTRVVLTTVGPYQLYGGPVVAACAAAGTDYVDLCGEVPFMRQTIDAHESMAQHTGARIVFSTGFDSVPFDLGVYFLQEQARERFGQPFSRVKGRVAAMNGTFSGGTLASGQATMAAAMKNPHVMQLLMSPWALTPDFQGPAQPAGNEVMEDPAVGSWVAPFVMAQINTRNIHRSNLLLGHAWGEDFVYDEMMMTGPGDAGRKMAEAVAGMDMMAADDNAPKPGEGPSKAEREAGNYDLLFVGERDDGTRMTARVTGDMDPGYGSTSKIIAECALCLTEEAKDLPGGVYTPASAYRMAIVERLRTHAGLTFDIVD
ncbi:MAG TPA: saccharopine dehydrogenase NADP-binding domain-containing protein [Pseudomonadales bacterium]|nr:saccharopine dehydrogenase NADP-binding domain-containing protein [Pseudomonadales bacterium]